VRESSFDEDGVGSADRAVKFDGVDDYILVPDASTLQFGGTEFSVTAWVKLDSSVTLTNVTDVYPVASKWTSTESGFEFSVKGGSTGKGLSFRTMVNGAQTQELVPTEDKRALLTDQKPHLVCFTRDNSNVGRLYIDGELVSSATTIAGNLSTDAELWIGKNNDTPDSKYFKGVLEDVKLFSSTVRPDEISAAFDSDADTLPDWWELKYFGNLTYAAGWDFDEGEGDGLSNWEEYENGSNPNLKDSDGDGANDGEEVLYDLDPTQPALLDSTGTYVTFDVFTPLEF
jgi:hypothetical protein